MDISIDITTGTLKDRISSSRINGITSLTLRGSINGDDIEFIRRHTGGYDSVDFRQAGPLEMLDLSRCRFTPGGIYKTTEFMGHYKGSIEQFFQMWTPNEYGGAGYGLLLTNSDEISNEMFLKCYKLKKIFLPENIKRIGNLTFYRCNNLEIVYIGNEVESIGEFAFYNTFRLKEIHISSIKPPVLSKFAFRNPKYHNHPSTNPKNKITLYVPRGSSSDYWLQWGIDNVIEE